MEHVAGSTKNGRDSIGKRLGIKAFTGVLVKAGMRKWKEKSKEEIDAKDTGNILCRQRGAKFRPGENVYMSRDYTLHARVPGHVFFTRDESRNRRFINVKPIELPVLKRDFLTPPPETLPSLPQGA